MTSAIITGVSIIAIFFLINILRERFPIGDTSGYSQSDLPSLRKKYAAIAIVGVIINVLIFFGGIVFTFWIWGGHRISPWLPFSIPFLALAIVPWVELKLFLYKKDEEWKKGFKAYLDLIYNMDYFATSRKMSLILIIIGLVFMVVGLYKTYYPL